jgi:hypothetical protein
MKFAFPLRVSDINDVPEIFRNLYEDDGTGVFTLKEVAREHVDTSGLRSALEKERTARKEAAAISEGFLKHAESPDALAVLLDDLRAAANKASGVDQRTLEKAKAEIEAGYAKKEAAWQAQLTQMESSLVEHMVTGEAERALAAEKGSSLFLMPHIRGQVKVLREGDRYVAKVIDKDGDPRINGHGETMTVADLVREMKSQERFQPAFQVDPKGGSGKPPGSVGNPAPPSSGNASANPVDRIAAGLAKRGS